MKVKKLRKRTFLIAAAILMLCPAAFGQKHWDAPRVVTWNCSGCHGIDGNAQLPYIPRLGGLNGAYAEQKIAQFRAAAAPPVDELFYRFIRTVVTRPGASKHEEHINMVGIGHAITDEETKAAAAWYAKQKRAPGRSTDAALIEQGKAVYLNGLAAQGLPSCQTCHGARAEGKGKIPFLAGQNGVYLLGELQKFNAGDRQHAPEMTMVTQHVDSDSQLFRAVAAYLQSR